jgi:hypothetical protein
MDLRNNKGQFNKGHKIGLGNKYRVGFSPWNKGLKKENSNCKGGRKFGSKDSYKRDISNYKGHKKLIGRKLSEEVKKKISETEKKSGHKPIPMYGVDNWNWKGGITPLNEKIRKSLEIKLWKKSCLSRDMFTCKKCLLVGGKLEVHHINNFADFPELRTSIENGITFCRKCHIRFHSLYGRRNNTREQLITYLND